MPTPVVPHRIGPSVLALLAAVLFACGAVAAETDLEFQHRFRHLTLEDGLSQSSVNAVLQDRFGFVWLATQDGLNRYDGHEFIVNKSDPDDPYSLTDAYVTCVAEDGAGDLWLGTDNGGFGRFDRITGRYHPVKWQRGPGPHQNFIEVTGLKIDPAGRIWVGTRGHGVIAYDPRDQSVSRYQHRAGDTASLPSDEVIALLVGAEGTVWAGTGAGLASINPQNGEIRIYRQNTASNRGPGGARVTALLQALDGQLWVGTNGGLDRFLIAGEIFEHHLAGADADADLRGVDIQAMVADHRGRLWIGGEDLGLLVYQPETRRVQVLEPDPYDGSNLQDDRVHALFVDEGGVLWVGHDLGVSLLDGHAKPFYHYHQRRGAENCLSNNTVWSLWEDRRGIVWVATSDGLNQFDLETGRLSTLDADPDDPQRPALPRYTSVCETGSGEIWLGFAYGGLERYDPRTGIFTRIAADSTGQEGAPCLRVYAMKEGPDGRLWMGTFRGIQSYDPRSGRFDAHFDDPKDPLYLGGHSCRAFDLDARGHLWVGTWGDGVVHIDPVTGERHHYRHDPHDRRSLTDDTIISLTVAQTGDVWVGTGSGLNCMDARTGSCLRYTESDGLPNNTVYGIVEDHDGMIWAGTNFGLIRLDPRTLTQDHFRAKDGVQSNEFNMGACHLGRSGRLYVGGINGFNVFTPDQIHGNDYVPPVVITDFRIFNKTVIAGEPVDERLILEKPIFSTDSLELTHRDYVISFSFGALHYAAPEKNRYAYILEGFDTDWTEAGSRQHATYTNLPPGEYVFRVRGTNNDGVWNLEGAAVGITVKPPFWRTAWFITLAVFLALTGLNAVIRYRTRLMNIRTRELEARVTQRTSDLTRANHFLQQEISERRRVEEALRVAKEQAEAATEAKSEFLANMSHEIRTPMNGVLGMTSILLEGNLAPSQREHLEVVYESARNLLSIINDILDFSRVEAGKLELECIDFDTREMVEDIGEMLGLRARTKGLRYTTVVDHRVPALLRGDPGRLRQILVNLTNNAVKFTDQGKVEVRVGLLERHPTWAKVRFEVADTGVGIPSDRMDRLFDSFSQVDTSTTRQYGGTGLGLAISKQLADLMHGEFAVDSAVGQGTRFWLDVDLGVGEQPDAGDGGAKRGSVLVAIEDSRLRDSLVEQLRYLNWQPTVVETIDAAAAACRDAQNSDTAFTTVIAGPWCDVERMKEYGHAVAAWPNTIRIALTDPGQTLTDSDLQAAGFDVWSAAPMRTRRLDEMLVTGKQPFTAPVSSSADPGAVGRPELTSASPATDAVVPDDRLDSAAAEDHPRLPLLLAEDNPINQRVASLLLRKLGHEVDVVDNGAEALEALARRRYALVFMDVQMPTMDGYEAVAHIRRGDAGVLDPRVSIVALTAHAMKGDRERCLSAGMDDYLAKPIDAAKLEAVLVKRLGQRSTVGLQPVET